MPDLTTRRVRILYTNYRGERKAYIIEPTGRFYFGTTEYHPEPQWLMEATKIESGVIPRTFAVKDIHSWEPIND